MADLGTIHNPTNGASAPRSKGPSKSQQLNKLYSLPAPVRTFPLPTFVPHNPISLFHIVYAWVSQTINPPSSHPETLYHGWFSPETRSVHVTDPESIQALWRQGFYGKGSLSRSELSWLDREKRRKGDTAEKTSEEATRQRRAERQQVKWERARKEREVINKRLLEERGSSQAAEALDSSQELRAAKSSWLAPVGPLEILALPNSRKDLRDIENLVIAEAPPNDKDIVIVTNNHVEVPGQHGITIPLPGGESFDMSLRTPTQSRGPAHHTSSNGNTNGKINGSAYLNGSLEDSSKTSSATDLLKQAKGQKSVRFSPTVEQTTFLQSEPPSPEIAATSLGKADDLPIVIEDKEHLQLMFEEALFLSYGLGVFTILDPKTKAAIPQNRLLSVFRQNSCFPPPETPVTATDDPFMLSYVVYHHFRSLGWVVRGGTKFGVDYLLYNRGPVFSHAEFAVTILPSYSDPAWSKDAETRDYVSRREKKRWSWLHCVNRVNVQVKKTLLLVYVDIPPPMAHLEDHMDIDGILKQYKIREFVLKRWLSNRMRD